MAAREPSQFERDVAEVRDRRRWVIGMGPYGSEAAFRRVTMFRKEDVFKAKYGDAALRRALDDLF